MRAKRSGQAAKIRRTAVGRCGAGAGRLALCLLAALPVQAARNTKSTVFRGYCGVAHLGCLWQADRPLYRQSCVSSGARPCLCGGYSGAGSAGWCGDCGGIQPKLRQPSAHPAPGWLRDPLRAPAIPLCPPGRGGTGRADAGHSGADRARHRCAPASGTVAAGRCLRPRRLLETAP